MGAQIINNWLNQQEAQKLQIPFVKQISVSEG